jgi:Na+/proline symporter
MSLAIALIYYVVLIAVVGYIAKKHVKSAADFPTASGPLNGGLVCFGCTLLPLAAGHTISLWEAAPGLGASVMWWGIITGGIFLP